MRFERFREVETHIDSVERIKERERKQKEEQEQKEYQNFLRWMEQRKQITEDSPQFLQDYKKDIDEYWGRKGYSVEERLIWEKNVNEALEALFVEDKKERRRKI